MQMQDATVLFVNTTTASNNSSSSIPQPQTLIILTASIAGTILLIFLFWAYFYLTSTDTRISSDSNNIKNTTSTPTTTSNAKPNRITATWFSRNRSPTLPLFQAGPQDLHLLREVMWSSPEDTAGDKIGTSKTKKRLPSAAWNARMDMRKAALGSHPLEAASAGQKLSRASTGSSTSPRTLCSGGGRIASSAGDGTVSSPAPIAERTSEQASTIQPPQATAVATAAPSSRLSSLLVRRHLSRAKANAVARARGSNQVLALALPAIAGYSELHDNDNDTDKAGRKQKAKDDEKKTRGGLSGAQDDRKKAESASAPSKLSLSLKISSPKLADTLKARLAERYNLLSPGRARARFNATANTIAAPASDTSSSNSTTAPTTTARSHSHLAHPGSASSSASSSSPRKPLPAALPAALAVHVLSPTIAHRRVLTSGPTNGDVVDDLRSPYDLTSPSSSSSASAHFRSHLQVQKPAYADAAAKGLGGNGGEASGGYVAYRPPPPAATQPTGGDGPRGTVESEGCQGGEKALESPLNSPSPGVHPGSRWLGL